MKKIVFFTLCLFLISCSPQTKYVETIKVVVPDIPKEMTEPIPVKKYETQNMKWKDLVEWWLELRRNLDKANSKLVKIRAWYNQQKEILEKDLCSYDN